MIDISYTHNWRQSDYGTRMKCENCESFYDIEMAKEFGVPEMGLCKPQIIRDLEDKKQTIPFGV